MEVVEHLAQSEQDESRRRRESSPFPILPSHVMQEDSHNQAGSYAYLALRGNAHVSHRILAKERGGEGNAKMQ